MSENRKQRVREVYDFIRAYKIEHAGTAPSVEEIGIACTIGSKNTVIYYLCYLERDGLIKRSSISRDIHLPGEMYFAPNYPYD